MVVDKTWAERQKKDPLGTILYNYSEKMCIRDSYKMVLNKAAMKAMGYAQLEDAFVRSESPLWISVSEKGEMEEGGTKLMPVVAIIDDYYPSCNLPASCRER